MAVFIYPSTRQRFLVESCCSRKFCLKLGVEKAYPFCDGVMFASMLILADRVPCVGSPCLLFMSSFGSAWSFGRESVSRRSSRYFQKFLGLALDYFQLAGLALPIQINLASTTTTIASTSSTPSAKTSSVQLSSLLELLNHPRNLATASYHREHV